MVKHRKRDALRERSGRKEGGGETEGVQRGGEKLDTDDFSLTFFSSFLSALEKPPLLKIKDKEKGKKSRSTLDYTGIASGVSNRVPGKLTHFLAD